MKNEVQIPVSDSTLNATLTVPRDAIGLVLFAHGSGSGRKSPRNQMVAAELNKANIATLLLDLLTPSEEEAETAGSRLRFDIEFLSKRLRGAVNWCGQQENLRALPIGIFGASTGAACALQVATQIPEIVRAVVSRGGRPDLAMHELDKVKCPVLLIVGANDEAVIELNKTASAQLKSYHKLETIPNATHLFEEPGALELVAEIATSWFVTEFEDI